MRGKNVYICLSTGEMYAQLCTVAMVSCAIHMIENCKLHFYVIDNGLTAQTQKKMRNSLERYDVELEFVQGVDVESVIGSSIDPGEWTLNTLQRLFITKLFPANVERVLYLDCDVLVRKSLEEMYFTPLNGCYAAGVSDCISALVRRNIGLRDDSNYMNGGVLLIDLNAWRENQIEQQFVSFFKEHLNHLQYFDQDIINGVLSQQLKMLPAKYNSMTAMFNYTRKELMFYHDCQVYHSDEIYNEAVQNPVIVHFSTDALSVRPWFINGSHPFRDEWLQMRAMTAWKDEPLWENHEKLLKKVKRMAFKMLPKSLVLNIARKIHRRNSLKYCKLEN